MKTKVFKIIIAASVLSCTASPVLAESLFRTGISQNAYPFQPRALFNTVKAKNIGDVVIVALSENSSAVNDVKLSINDTSSSSDKFSGILNTIFKTDRIPSLDGYGGTTTTGNNANITRTSKITDTITTQVVQILPNGNLVIQGKKLIVNSGEKAEVVISGIVDPRFISNAGQVSSTYIANLQCAIAGKGTLSSSDSESMMNKFMKMLY